MDQTHCRYQIGFSLRCTSYDRVEFDDHLFGQNLICSSLPNKVMTICNRRFSSNIHPSGDRLSRWTHTPYASSAPSVHPLILWREPCVTAPTWQMSHPGNSSLSPRKNGRPNYAELQGFWKRVVTERRSLSPYTRKGWNFLFGRETREHQWTTAKACYVEGFKRLGREVMGARVGHLSYKRRGARARGRALRTVSGRVWPRGHLPVMSKTFFTTLLFFFLPK